MPDIISNCSVEYEKIDALSQIVSDLNSVAEWYCINRLLINPEKTKFIPFGTRQLIGKLSDITIPILGRELSPSSFSKDLGVIFDLSNFSFYSHVNYLSSSLLGKLCEINSVQHLITKDVLSVILNSLVFSKFTVPPCGQEQHNRISRNCSYYRIL